MKIAILRKKYTFHGGAEGFSQNLLLRLAGAGNEVHIYSIRWSAGPYENIHFHKVPAVVFNSFLRDLTYAVSSFFLLKRQRGFFDVIQSHDKTLYQDIYRAGDGCHIEWLKQRWKRTSIPGRLSIIFNPYHWLILSLERMILKGHRFKKIIAISEMVKKNIIENYNVSPDDIEVIYNGVDLNKFHPDNKRKYREEVRKKYGLGDTEFVVLFMGSGFERKGVKYLIEAVEVIPEPVTLLIVGKGATKKYKTTLNFQDTPVYKDIIPAKAEIQKKRLDSPVKPENDELVYSRGRQKIIFCGPQKDNHKYYAAAEVFVTPSIYEPFGNVHLEALASGLPVITTRQSGASEIIRNGKQGFVAEKPEDINEMAERIRELMDKDVNRKMSMEARRLAEKFSFEEHIKRTLELYKKIAVTGSNSGN